MPQDIQTENPTFDLFIIGGGINGCGIARDAAGRGLKVGLAEMNDFAWATSSASTKLFHGGLRYLEYFEFRLVREALIEREILLRAMPHISWPMRFVLPYHKDMRFENDTPTSKLLSTLLGRRCASGDPECTRRPSTRRDDHAPHQSDISRAQRRHLGHHHRNQRRDPNPTRENDRQRRRSMGRAISFKVPMGASFSPFPMRPTSP